MRASTWFRNISNKHNMIPQDEEKDTERLLKSDLDQLSDVFIAGSQRNDPSLFWSRLATNLLFLLLLTYTRGSQCFGTYEKGFDTDLAVAKGEIELQKVLFTGGIHFNADGSVYIQDASGPKYVGIPEPAIDKAWDELLKESAPFISRSNREFRRVSGPRYQGQDLFQSTVPGLRDWTGCFPSTSLHSMAPLAI
ncbi:hypothetical protein ASPZODRAFT_138839 [Penicilliopsis zonata CBS 506.65]|uniref:Uncharacterized protein n=1 Tax=Penicilliopsis zonata CBS 506.65 TaxID=1073090 RepID=A0A1L9SXA2_9EURO|nr:hypothetical protein ASPZODRAFT_138839 [Penicilliopsis zonata CBS 506.65]OJJ51779.1 hypothetical protein ASPZODRAFT_138839 [Penicilliopsis zonata CBS 506.65]